MSTDILDPNLCCIKGCDSKVLAHGMCVKHERRMRLYGSPVRAKAVQYHGLSHEERFFKWVEKTDDCWLWKGRPNREGYGRINIGTNGKTKLVQPHRYSWEIHRGPIPPGMNVCHKCDVRSCVNPDQVVAPGLAVTGVDHGRPCYAILERQRRGALGAGANVGHRLFRELGDRVLLSGAWFRFVLFYFARHMAPDSPPFTFEVTYRLPRNPVVVRDLAVLSSVEPNGKAGSQNASSTPRRSKPTPPKKDQT